MSQVHLAIPAGRREGDLSRGSDNAVLVDDGLETVIAISLHTDIAATDDDGLPIEERRGYWADTVEDDLVGGPIGSRLWLVARNTLTPATLLQAQDAALEAVKWLVDEGAVGRFECEAVRSGTSANDARLALYAYRPGETSPYYTYTWELHFALDQ